MESVDIAINTQGRARRSESLKANDWWYLSNAAARSLGEFWFHTLIER